MVGFTESFNLSVSAAIVLYEIHEKLKKQQHIHWQLSKEEKEAIRLQWLRNTIKNSHLLEQHFIEKT